jgi:hypothetical protein
MSDIPDDDVNPIIVALDSCLLVDDNLNITFKFKLVTQKEIKEEKKNLTYGCSENGPCGPFVVF